LLKTASYGQLLLKPEDEQFDLNLLKNTCLLLRALNAVNDNPVCKRTMTFKELQHLIAKGSLLFDIVQRYALHNLAFQIGKLLNLHPEILKCIVREWAKSKIASSQSDEVTFRQLQYYSERTARLIPYSELARLALEGDKPSLAKHLASLEENLFQKLRLVVHIAKQE